MEGTPNIPPVVPPPDQEERYFNEPILQPTSSVRQHTVPRLYLAYFKEEDGTVPALDLEEKRSFSASLENIAVECGYYDLQVAGRALSIEDWLAEVEGRAAPILSELEETPGTLNDLSEDQQNDLGRYIAAQIFRVPAFRDLGTATRDRAVEWIRDMGRAYLEKNMSAEKAAAIWRVWEEKPSEWWLRENEPRQDAELTAHMLGEVQGWANLLVAMPWRIGRIAGNLKMYTSDNPVSGYVPPVRPWWAGGGAIWEHLYVFPLSPRVLIWIDPLGYGADVPQQGTRSNRDFSEWEVSFARHLVTDSATRFLIGPPPYVSRECANVCRKRLEFSKVYDATRLQGFDPRPPRSDFSTFSDDSL
jgi:hypothetical protein